MLTQFEVETLLCYVMQVDRSFLKAYPEKLLTKEQLLKLSYLISRRKKLEPMAYLLKNVNFWDLNLLINNKVLIPRAETELLVEKALELIPIDSSANILELGTGSGAISLSLAKHRKKISIIATDISIAALKIAHANAKNLDLKNISFLCCDWFRSLSTSDKQKFDLIISNPPYIGFNEIDLCDPGIFYEPMIALFAKEEGLGCLKNIIFSSGKHLKKDGILLLEHGFKQSKKLQELCKLMQFKNIRTYQDLSNIDRIIIAQKK